MTPLKNDNHGYPKSSWPQMCSCFKFGRRTGVLAGFSITISARTVASRSSEGSDVDGISKLLIRAAYISNLSSRSIRWGAKIAMSPLSQTRIEKSKDLRMTLYD